MISASPISHGRPGRGSSKSPSTRRSANLRRHLPTVLDQRPTPRRCPGSQVPQPRATQRARLANPCAVRRRPARPSSSRRSALVNSITTAGFPWFITSKRSIHDPIYFSIRTLGVSRIGCTRPSTTEGANRAEALHKLPRFYKYISDVIAERLGEHFSATFYCNPDQTTPS
jgi:hypothetical protein